VKACCVDFISYHVFRCATAKALTVIFLVGEVLAEADSNANKDWLDEWQAFLHSAGRDELKAIEELADRDNVYGTRVFPTVRNMCRFQRRRSVLRRGGRQRSRAVFRR